MTDDPLEGALHRSTNGRHRNDRARQTRARVGGGAEYKVVCDFLTLFKDEQEQERWGNASGCVSIVNLWAWILFYQFPFLVRSSVFTCPQPCEVWSGTWNHALQPGSLYLQCFQSPEQGSG